MAKKADSKVKKMTVSALVLLWVEKEVPADNLAQAHEALKQMTTLDFVSVRPGVELIDDQIKQNGVFSANTHAKVWDAVDQA